MGKLDEVKPPFTQVLRKDGFKQWALRDKPLYLFKGDAAAGTPWAMAKWPLAPGPQRTHQPKTAADNTSYWAAFGSVWKLGAASLTDATGFALYTFAKDVPGSSNCLDTCAKNWPPLLAGAADTASAPYSLISRSDSELKQWAYNGKPSTSTAATA